LRRERRLNTGIVAGAAARTGALNGQKVEARGLLYRDGSYADLNLTSLRAVASSCSK